MPFTSGRASFIRFKVSGKTPYFDQEHLDKLAANAIGTSKIASADGIDCGFTAGDHVFDTQFKYEKNIADGALLFSIRVDMDKPPAELLQAYTAIELNAMAKENPSGTPSRRQKREAREAARERIEKESKDGRFRKRMVIPCVWDKNGELWYGSTSFAHVDRASDLIKRAFGVALSQITAGNCAGDLKEGSLSPSKFTTHEPNNTAWVADPETNFSWLGNEFLLWLWYYGDEVDDTINMPSGDDLTFIFSRSLKLDCPNGQNGSDTFASESPSRLREAKRAIQLGKLPRKAGLTFATDSQQYEFTLGAESLSFSTLKLPAIDGDDVQVGNQASMNAARINQIRNFLKAFDTLYAIFVDIRSKEQWGLETIHYIRSWVGDRA